MFRTEDQVPGFLWITANVIELVAVPDAVVMDVFVLPGSDGVDGRRVREIFFPIIFVEQRVAPRHLLALRQRHEVLPIHVIRRFQASGFQESRPHIYVRDHLLHHGAAFE